MEKEQRQALKQKYGQFYWALVQLSPDMISWGLIKMGAPADEYEPEVDVILSRLNEASSPDALGYLIYKAFVQCFGSTFSSSSEPLSEQAKAYFAAMGRDAWDIWKRWTGERA